MWTEVTRKGLLSVAAAWSVAALFSFPAHPADIRVPADFPTIQQAIDAAVAGDTILVSNGAWSGEGNRDLDLRGKAITVTGAGGDGTCVIVAGGSQADPHRAFDLHRSEGRETVIRGLTIREGYSTGDFSQDDGAGIRLRGASPTIIDCVFFDNYSGGAGGGIACFQGSNALIQDCTFNGNSAFDGGGAVGCDTSSPVIRDNLMIWNGAYRSGGAILLYRGSSPEISGNSIVENLADLGGAICCQLNSSPLIEENVISGNSAAWYGGGIMINDHCSPQLRNNLLNNNSATLGGGIDISYASNAVIENCTLASNIGSALGGAIHASDGVITLSGCILWDNQADNGAAIALRSFEGSTTANLVWTDIQYGDHAVYEEDGSNVIYGPGVISADPLFVRGPDGPCCLSHLATGQYGDSPCVDAGDPSSAPPVGTTRTDRAPDLGTGDLGFHYEADWTAACDLDGSGRVDGGDLSILARAWGASDGESRYDPRADINGSGVVDGEDLALLASLFGETV